MSIDQAPAAGGGRPDVDAGPAPAQAPGATPAAGALEVRGLALSFGGPPVLAGVDLAVPRGSVVALVGPSGCGKTTLVRLVAGFEKPDAGSLDLAGRTVSAASADRRSGVHVPPERRRVGVVPQEGALFAHLDVAANVGFGLPRGGRTPEGRRRVAHLLDLVGLTGLGDRLPDQISGGQQQRVAVARALAPRPDLVLLDEPFSALDAALRQSVRDAVMGALRSEQASVLLVTHDQDEALSVADVVAVMLDGRIAQVGPPDVVYGRPATAQVARFLGDAILIPAVATGRSARTELGEVALAEPAHGPVTVMVRPEQVVPEVADPVEPGDAVVTALSFHGHDALLTLRTPSGTGLQSRVLGGWRPQPGQSVRLHVRGECWALPA